MIKKILFIHHSTGGNLIEEGHLRDEIKRLDPSIQLWDHSYNLSPVISTIFSRFTHLKGLSDNQGNITGTDYKITLSNNSPKEYADIFSRNRDDVTLKSILNYNVIAFKNCFPTTFLSSDQKLNEDMKYYTIIRNSLRKYPKKQFVILTSPPLRREMTTTENAKRAIRISQILLSDTFLDKTKNLHVFDFFTYLADSHGFLRKEYSLSIPFDSHPNRIANECISPIFAGYLVDIANHGV